MTVDGSTDHTRIVRRDRGALRLPTVLGMRLQQRVGVGGEGEVWSAQARDGTMRAVKLIRPDVVAEPVAFARRAKALERIDDPSLVRVFDAGIVTEGEWSGWGAMVMDLVDGVGLDDERLGPAAFVELEPLAVALDLLHDGEWSDGDPLVHRDVKPSNLIREHGTDRIVLVDPSSLRGVGGDMTYVGTPLFVAPEVPTGRFGPPADIYSFAATLVALHSGARGHELAELLAEPDDLDLPEPVIQALSVLPELRPERCAELVDSTRTVVMRSTTAASTATQVPPAPQTRRTWWRMALLTLTTVPMVVGLLLGLPTLVLGGAAALLAALMLEEDLRTPSSLWLPLAVGRWLGATTDVDDAEHDRLVAVIHGAYLLPLVPFVGAGLGYGPAMAVLGTPAQIAGVALVAATGCTWIAVAAVGVVGGAFSSGLAAARLALVPLWMLGMFASGVGRVLIALDDALRSRAEADPKATTDRQLDGDHAAE